MWAIFVNGDSLVINLPPVFFDPAIRYRPMVIRYSLKIGIWKNEVSSKSGLLAAAIMKRDSLA